MMKNAPLGARRRTLVSAAAILGIVAAACGDPDPETVLLDASESLVEAEAAVEAADAEVAEIGEQIAALEEELAEAERARRDAAKHLHDAETRVTEAASDDVLFRSVQRRLLEDVDLKGSAVRAAVVGRAVTLMGEVQSQDLIETAIEVAVNTPGVATVESQIRVSTGNPTAPGPAPQAVEAPTEL